MAAEDDEAAGYEIVFAIEATSNMVNHFESMKKQYIFPIIEHFHKCSSGSEVLPSLLKNLYGLVLFYAADKTPDSLTECFPPLPNRWQFSKMLESIELNGGGAEHHSYIAEGLATVLQLFDDMKNQQKNKNVERFCFIISNTPPYELPAVESFTYSGISYQNMAEKLKQRNIKLSIICPHLIKELKQLFVIANDNPTPLMNYAQDKRHLVLISGFRLILEKEPWQLNDNATNDTITTVKTEVPATIAMDVAPLNEDIVPPAIAVKPEFPSLPQPSPLQPSSTSSLYNAGTTVTTSNPSVSHTQIAASQTNFPSASQAISVKTEPMIIDNKPTPAPSAANVPTRGTVSGFPPGNQVPDPNSAVQYGNAMKEAQKVIEFVSSQAIEPNHRLIWTGVLEWVEKRRLPLPTSKITQNVQCQISQSMTANPRDAINAANWFSKLAFQLIPQVVLSQSSVLQSYLKANKQVTLNFPSQNVTQMANVFSQRNVIGLIQHLSSNEEKLIVFFVKKKDDRTTFVGILPDDPQGFMGALRNVITAKYSRRPNMGMQQPSSGEISGQKPMVQSINQQSSVIVTEQNVNPGMQQFHANQQPHIQYQQTMPNQEFPGSSNQPPRINQTVNPGMTTLSTINVSISQPHVNIRPQSGQSVMRPQISDNMKVISNIHGGMAPTNNTGQQLRTGPRVLPSGMTIQNNPNTGMMKMQTFSNISSNMSGNRPISQGSSQLRTLLGPGNNVMQAGTMNIHQQDNSSMRSNASNSMQPQGFRGNNLMPGIQNQRNF